MPSNRWFYSIKTHFSSKKSLSFFTIAIVILSIPLTVFFVQIQQDIRQRAQTSETSPEIVSDTKLPWKYSRSESRKLPVVSAATKQFISNAPYSSKTCNKKTQGDADCNDVLDQADVSYWQIDFESNTTKFADFNNDKKVDLVDYAIWRQNADLPKKSVIRKITQALGLDRFFAGLSWNLFSPIGWTAYAQEATTTLTNSQLLEGNGIYQVVNEYENQGYAVVTLAEGTNQSQIAFYTSTGQQVAEMSNFLQSNNTVIIQSENDTVSITHDPAGAVIQTAQDANGAIIASQAWPDQDAFARNEPPQSATVPTSNGFATLSIQPNDAGILIQRDVNGNIVGRTSMNSEGLIATTDYKKRMAVIAGGSTGVSFANMEIKDGMSSLIFYAQKLIGATKRNTKTGQVRTAFVSSDGLWTITIYDKNGGVVSQNTVTDIAATPDPNFPDLAMIIERAKNYHPPTSSTQFSQAFLTTSSIARQTATADALVAVSNTQAVLGAQTVAVKPPTKAVLASTSTDVPLSSPVSLPGGTATQLEVTISSWEPTSGPNAGTTVYAASVTPLDANHQPVGPSQSVISDTDPVTTAPSPSGVAQQGGYSPAGSSSGSSQPAPEQQVAEQPAAQQPAAQQPAAQQSSTTTQVTVNGVTYNVGYSTANPGQVNSIINVVTGERLSIEGGNWSHFENGIKSAANLTPEEKATINAVVTGPAGSTGVAQVGFQVGTDGQLGNQVSIPPTSGESTAPPGTALPGSGTVNPEAIHPAASAAVAALGPNPNPAVAAQTAAVAALAAGATGTQASVEAMYFAAQFGATTEQIRSAGATANFLGGQTGVGLIENLAAVGVEINPDLATETGQGLGSLDGSTGGINEGIATDAAMGASYASVAAAYEAYAANPTAENYASLDAAIDGFVDVARESGYNDSSINEAISQATDGNFGEASSTPGEVSGSLDGGGGGGGSLDGGGGSLDGGGGGSQSFDSVSNTDNSQGSVDSNSGGSTGGSGEANN